MIFKERSFLINELGYIEMIVSYEDYSHISDHLSHQRILTSTRTRPVLDNSGELTVIIPQWILKLRDELSGTIDSLTEESMDYLRDLSGGELIRELSVLDRSVSLWLNTVQSAEEAYKTLIHEDELCALHVKDILPLCTALEFTLRIDSEFFIDNIWGGLQ